MEAADTATMLESGPTGPVPEPTSERQMRPLAPLKAEPEKLREAWELGPVQPIPGEAALTRGHRPELFGR